MNKILDVMEDIKQNITDNQYKIIMDSLMEIKNGNEKEERVTRLYYSQQEFDKMTKVMIKLSIEIYFEYTDDEKDVVWSDSIKTLIGSYLEKHKIGLDSYRLEDYILEILKNNNSIIKSINPKNLNHVYCELCLRKPKIKDYNNLIDSIIQISPPYRDANYCHS